MAVNENVKNVDTWVRGLFIIVFGIIFHVLYWVLWLLVVFQFITKVISGSLNQRLMVFSDGLTRYAMQILHYITFQSELRPFPFSPWPESGSGTTYDQDAESVADADVTETRDADDDSTESKPGDNG